MQKRFIALVSAIALSISCCAMASAQEHTQHTIRSWHGNEDGTHTGRCVEPDCRVNYKVFCTKVSVEMPDGTVAEYCPICGEFDEGKSVLPQVLPDEWDDFEQVHIVKQRGTLGTPIIRMGDIGQDTTLFTFCFNLLAGPSRSETMLTVTVPSDLIEGKQLIAVAGVKEKGLHVDIEDGLARIRMTLAGKPAAMLMFGH